MVPPVHPVKHSSVLSVPAKAPSVSSSEVLLHAVASLLDLVARPPGGVARRAAGVLGGRAHVAPGLLCLVLRTEGKGGERGRGARDERAGLWVAGGAGSGCCSEAAGVHWKGSVATPQWGRWRRNLPTTGPKGACKGSTGPLVSWLQTIGSVAAVQGLHQGLPAAAIPIHRIPGSNGVSGHSFRESKTTSQQLIGVCIQIQ